MEKSKRYIYMDLLKIIAAFAVVTLHSAGGNFGFEKIYPSLVLTILVQVIFCIGVPVFFMESGATILSYRQRYNTKVFIHKRFSKVVIPFVFWSVFGYLFLIFFYHINNYSLLDFIHKFIYGQIVGPYWFFYNLIGFYICAPFLSKIMVKENKKIILYLITSSIILESLIPSIFIYMHLPVPGFIDSIPTMGSYLEYFLLGWYIHNFEISQKNKRLLITLGLICLCVTLVGSPIISIQVGHIYKPIYDIANIFTVIIMINIYMLSKRVDSIKFFNNHSILIKKVAVLTFGVYLIHPFILGLLSNIKILNPTGIAHIVIYPVIIFFLSMVVAFLLRKIPFVKYIIP